MEIYETEEQQVEALKRWWKTNGASIIAGIIVAMIAIGGWKFWRSYQQDLRSQASALYEQLHKDLQQGRHDEVQKVAQRLSENYASTAYASFAELLSAKSKVQRGELEAAKGVLQALLKEADSDEIRNVARMRLVRLMLSTGDYKKGLQLIAEADPATTAGFTAGYEELKGDLYVALDRLGEARTAYQNALRSGSNSPLLQFKLDDITAAAIVTDPQS